MVATPSKHRPGGRPSHVADGPCLSPSVPIYVNWPATSAFNLLLKKVPGVRKASLLLVTTGTVGSEMKVNCNVACVFALPSVTVSATPKFPSEVGVPEMRPVTGSIVNSEPTPSL